MILTYLISGIFSTMLHEFQIYILIRKLWEIRYESKSRAFTFFCLQITNLFALSFFFDSVVGFRLDQSGFGFCGISNHYSQFGRQDLLRNDLMNYCALWEILG